MRHYRRQMIRPPYQARHVVHLLQRLLDREEIRLAARGGVSARYERARRSIYFRMLRELADQGRAIQRQRIATGALDTSEMISFAFTTWWRLSALGALGFGVLYLRADRLCPLASELAAQMGAILQPPPAAIPIKAE